MSNLGRSIAACKRELTNRLYTADEFHEAVEAIVRDQENGLTGLGYEVCSGEQIAESAADSLNAMNAEIGVSLTDRDPDLSHVDTVDNMGTTCRTKVWWSDDAEDRANSTKLFEDLFSQFWNSHLRTESAGMVDAKRISETMQRANAAVAHHARHGRDVSILFFDLDNFGQVNKKLSQSVGDRVIRELGLLLTSAVFEKGLIIHMGGDEFSIVVPECCATRALLWAYQIHQRISNHDFDIGDIKVGLSTGIACRSPSESKNLEQLIENANEVLKNVKEDVKGSARHWGYTLKETDCPVDRLDLSLCVVKCGVAVEFVFASPWLNVVSHLTRCAIREAPDTIAQIVSEFINWAALDIIQEEAGVSWHAAGPICDYQARASHLDICMAVCHGIHSAIAIDGSDVHGDLKIESLAQEGFIRVVCSDGIEYWSATAIVTDRVIELGPPFSFVSSQLDDWISPAILIQIGHDEPGIPKELYSTIITVDDRPTRGGGLPDFWGAAVGRVCSHVANTSGCTALYILGNVEHAAESVRQFESVETWEAERDYLSVKTGLPQVQITSVAERLAGNVKVCDSIADLVKHLAGLVVLPCSFDDSRSTGDDHAAHRIFRRKIDSSDIRLRDSDGCRVRTIAEAYPITLEIIRSSDNANTVRDLAGQEFRELRNFQIVLSEGGRDPIPHYYRDDGKSLDAYYDRNFMQADGLFRAAMDQNLQLQRVIEHVAKSLQMQEDCIATRRATIVLPHDTSIDDLEPLGLTSVNILPRKVNGEVQVHVSFTWRTVESLVGLPYSLYGSIRFSQELVYQIGAKLVDARPPILGEVTYIAGSLHISVNDSQQLIAKRIVDEASY